MPELLTSNIGLASGQNGFHKASLCHPVGVHRLAVERALECVIGFDLRRVGCERGCEMVKHIVQAIDGSELDAKRGRG